MDDLIHKRGRLKGKLTRIATFADQVAPATALATDLAVRLDTMAQLWEEFDKVQGSIESNCEETEMTLHLKEQEDFENKYYSIKSKLLNLKDQITRQPGGSGQATYHVEQGRPSQSESKNIKLPQIELPSFSGNYQDWISFEDLFTAVIDKNNSLSQVQKLHYLKSALKGDAARLLHSVAVTEANYVEAWNLLVTRYANKKQIIQAHVAALHAQTKVQNESSKELRKLLDCTTENIRALHALGMPTNSWDCLVVFIITERMDAITRRQWELASADSERPTFDDLKLFIEKRCRALEAAGVSDKQNSGTSKPAHQLRIKQQAAVSYQTSVPKCILCKDSHLLFRCPRFMAKSAMERYDVIRKAGLCINCLKAGHISRDCSSSHCKKCDQRHNTLLHRQEKSAEPPIDAPASEPTNNVVATHFTSNESKNVYVLLATAVIGIQTNSGLVKDVRVLLDCASQSSFISERCVHRLGLSKKETSAPILGIGGISSSTSKGRVQVKLSSKYTNYNFAVTALVLKQVTDTLPQQQLNPSMLIDTVTEHNLQLADPGYHRPGQIDMLIGADVYYDLMLPGKIRPFQSGLTLQNSLLGWVIGGPISDYKLNSYVSSYHVLDELSTQMRQFWELEELPGSSPMTSEEQQCENHFTATHTRTKSGRFMVDLPFKDEPYELSQTHQLATARLNQLERRLDRNPLHRIQYNEFMKEYINLGHMDLAPPLKEGQQPYYFPHHCIIKEQAITTKFRVVFDGSAHSSTGISLNQAMLVGQKLQLELPDILTNFRKHNIVYSADISRMYRQVLVNPCHRHYQRILWRPDTNMPIQEYELKTVTYGTSSAPFLAVRCLVELARQSTDTHPVASHILTNDFYVDDVLTGHRTLDGALASQAELIDLLDKGGFNLHKWASNSVELLHRVPSENHYSKNSLMLTPEVKTLGLIWSPKSDQFGFVVKVDSNAEISKRSILSQISQVFDPLGWLNPVFVWAKILMQRLWLLPVGWDDVLPMDIAEQWTTYRNQLPLLSQISIPRQLHADSSISECQLHGFSDASESAYGAVIYIRAPGVPSALVTIIRAKSRVAPLKRVSLPRLELCGAMVLSKLMDHIRQHFEVDDQHVHCWTDSTIVLAWISKPSSNWKSFVANRVEEIHRTTTPTQWHHVRSQDNPADCLSRGILPHQLKLHPLWWNGPDWLKLPEDHWPPFNEHSTLSSMELVPDLRTKCVHLANLTNTPQLELKYSSWMKLIRVTAYCFRFSKNCGLREPERLTDGLKGEELLFSETHWYRVVQQQCFPSEFAGLTSKGVISQNSPLAPLNPFLDAKNVMRVGGRLQSSLLSYSRRHPIILPHTHHITNLIIRSNHITHLHAGPQLLLAVLRQKYWIIRGKSIIRQLIHKCVICFKCKVKTRAQIMGPLPTHRVTPAKPFLRAGVDFAGPLSIRAAKGRGRIKTFKAYICVFVCFVTRAIHLELVGDLSSESFLAAFRRFIARRGRPADMYSDSGTNFVGAHHELQKLYHMLQSPQHKTKLLNFAHSESMRWHFNPPMAPHFGGLWEAGVKSVKYHLRRTTGPNILTYEELQTVLIQIEGCLNSRPLCPMTEDAQSLDFLTPGHFLIGESLCAIPDRETTTGQTNLRTRWALVQRSVHHFWTRWTTEYVSSLQQRPKWLKPQINLKIGDLVVLKDKGTPLFQWPMARVINTHPGPDNCVRVVTLKTASSTLKRAITSCGLLPISVD